MSMHPDSSFDWFGKSTTESTVSSNSIGLHQNYDKMAESFFVGKIPKPEVRESFIFLPLSVCLCRHSDSLCSMVQKRVNVTIMYQIDVLWVMQSCGIYRLLLFMLDMKCVLFFYYCL